MLDLVLVSARLTLLPHNDKSNQTTLTDYTLVLCLLDVDPKVVNQRGSEPFSTTSCRSELVDGSRL